MAAATLQARAGASTSTGRARLLRQMPAKPHTSSPPAIRSRSSATRGSSQSVTSGGSATRWATVQACQRGTDVRHTAGSSQRSANGSGTGRPAPACR